MEHHRVLGLDPAIKNYGFSMLEIREDLTAWRIIDCGLIVNPINEIHENFRLAIEQYTFEMRSKIQIWRPHDLVIERFQNRSRVGASQTEKVNIMIGLAALMGDQASCDIHAFTASQWKNKVNAKADLDDIYAATRSVMKDFCKANKLSIKDRKVLVGKVPHSVDSTILGLFVGSAKAGIDPFTFINESISIKVVKALVRGYV